MRHPFIPSTRKYILVFAGIIITGLITYCVCYYSSVEEITITVTDKERIVETNDGKTTSKYLVFSEGETFENQDEIIKWKFNSSDVQGKLKKDSTYTVEVIGWRIPFLSTYRNILTIK
jgi:uncharacterized protein YabE (DUF348 family)